MTASEKKNLDTLLLKHRSAFKNLFSFDIRTETTFNLDLSSQNDDFSEIDITNNEIFQSYLSNRIIVEGDRIPIGGYNERRILYSRSDHFGSGDMARDIHLGMDIWVDAGTQVNAPLDSIVHSFANNTNYRDYGPTIILQHKLEDLTFFTLYGHLSIESLNKLYEGKIIKAGDSFASIGSSEVNGTWPPHLHFQIISDMGKLRGDFPGVTSAKDRAYFLDICPDPGLILGL